MTETIQAPPSKSVSHRILVAAALARGRSTVRNLLRSRDTERTIACLQALGAGIEEGAGGSLLLDGPAVSRDFARSPVELDVGESGTTCRLITPVAALGGAACRIAGRGRMHERPVGELARALQDQGIRFAWEHAAGYPPFTLYPEGLAGGRVSVSCEQSSQFLSGLLLAAPRARRETVLTLAGESVVSWPYVALTLGAMQLFGAEFRVESLQNGSWRPAAWESMSAAEPGRTRFVVTPGAYRPRDCAVEGDWSNVSYFLAAGLLLPDGLHVAGLNAQSLQGDRKMIDLIEAMGGRVSLEPDLVGTFPAALRGTDLDLGGCPDLVPTVAVLASLASGPTRIRGVAHLRLKESDRLQGLAREIAKTGCGVELLPDGLRIAPGKVRSGETIAFRTYGDHRMAMSLSLYELAGLVVDLDDPSCVGKSFPDFWKEWDKVRQLHRGNRGGPRTKRDA